MERIETGEKEVEEEDFPKGRLCFYHKLQSPFIITE